MYNLTNNELRELQLIELDMLKEVDRICKKHEIKYTIIGGTLLGAVRHGGFIPWDDDADVAMVRSEYEKFCLVCKKELNKEKYYFQNMEETKGYRWGYAKIRRKDTVFLREGQEHMPYEQGIFLDIFPIDATPDNLFKRRIHNLQCFIVRKILWSAVGRLNERNVLKKSIYKCLYLIPEEKVKKIYNKLILKGNGSTKVVRTLTYPAPRKMLGYYRRWFEETDKIFFEGYSFDGVKDYDGWLSYEFGNYMELPPEDKRKLHPVKEFRLPQNQEG